MTNRFLLGIHVAWACLMAISARAEQVVINEIHYDADPKTDSVEFVEILNTGESSVDLSECRFSSGIEFLFPANTTLKPSGYLVVAETPTELRRKFKLGASAVLGPYNGRLSNSEELTLRDAAGRRVDRVEYGSGFPPRRRAAPAARWS